MIHRYLPVESTRPQQGRVEHIWPIGRGNQNDALRRIKSIHFDQQLVERLLTFIVATAEPRSPRSSDGVDLIDENDTGRLLFACSNISRTREAPTPTNISTKSDPLMLKKGTPASPAIAFANNVFPVPGGPTTNTPLGMRPPSF